MKLVTFSRLDGPERLGVLDGDAVIDLADAMSGKACYGNILSFIEAGDAALGEAAAAVAVAESSARVAFSEITLRAPIRPSTILCSGSNYRSHNAEKANTPISGKEPEFFVKTADCVIGPGDPIRVDDRLSKKFDCETELAVIIGKPGRFIAKENALSHVFGYTIVNDVTARDRQVRRSPEGFTWYELGSGKAFDCSAPTGPVIVTADEIDNPQSLDLKTRINGEPRQAANTAEMIWSCADLIHFFSVNFTLKPGMMIITGTPAGTAWSVDKDLGGHWTPAAGLIAATRYCAPGDIIESEIEKIGILQNPVIADF